MADKKIPAEAGRIRGILNLTPDNSVQSCPADQFHSVLLQVEIAGQNGFYVGGVGTLLHRSVQFYYTAKLIAAAIICVGQYELRVILRGHEVNLRDGTPGICEPQHKLPDPGGRIVKH